MPHTNRGPGERDKSIGNNRFEAAVMTRVTGEGVVALGKFGLQVCPGNVLTILQVGHVDIGILVNTSLTMLLIEHFFNRSSQCP